MIAKRTTVAFLCGVLVVALNTIQPQWQLWSKVTFYYGTTTTDLSVFSSPRPQYQRPLSARLTSGGETFDSFLFVGDILLARNVEVLMNRHGHSYPYEGIAFRSYAANPAIIGNFEASVPESHVFTPVNGLRFSVASRYLNALRQAGFTHLSLANNHALDFGPQDFTHTVGALESADFTVFGHPTTVTGESFSIVELSGTRVAVIGLHTLHGEPTAQELADVFTQSKKQSELQVVFVHWGEEYALTRSNAQRQFAENLVKLGADLIVGHHPHVVQGIELVNGVPVFYSLGNYIFDQYFSDEVQIGLMLHVEVAPEPKIHLLPVESKTSWSQPRAMDIGPHQLFLRELSERSDPILRPEINGGVILWNNLVATSSEIAMIE